MALEKGDTDDYEFTVPDEVKKGDLQKAEAKKMEERLPQKEKIEAEENSLEGIASEQLQLINILFPNLKSGNIVTPQDMRNKVNQLPEGKNEIMKAYMIKLFEEENKE